jgi:cell division protein ZapE
MPVAHLVDRIPEMNAGELITGLTPPPRFDTVRFASYVPDPAEPSQARAVRECARFAEEIDATRPGFFSAPFLRELFFRSRVESGSSGLYLDGGFGVGKTHLLASIWHAAPSPKAYCTFVELTSLVGALGFAETVRRLTHHRLLAIDEFELDDPGDTTLISRLLSELTSAGVRVAATSNTLPGKLGEGRFAAEDFLREIQSLAHRFTVVRVDGPDFRHRGLPEAPIPIEPRQLEVSAATHEGSTVDDFGALCRHLSTLHPSRYGRLVDGVSRVHLRDVRPAPDQSVALRLVAFIDRLYDRAIPVVASGVPLLEIFTDEMMGGGYRKKYSRALSRVTALARDAVVSA